MAYVIGSDKGKKIAEELQTGQTYQASDGSTWTKKSDGSVSVKTSAGETFNNAYTPSTAYNPYTTGNYSIGSAYGNQVAQNMGIDQSWTATDGSLWTKQKDGTITVNHNGVITNNAWTPSDYSTLAQQQIAAGVPIEYVQNTMLNREDKINSDPSLEKYRYDSTYWMMQNYIQDQMKKGNQQEAQDMFNQWLQEYEQNNPKQEYSGKYDTQIDALLNEILNRDDFSYDVANDPLYQQYKEQYQREGDRAMKNTLAEAAAGAGGMNTYAITAAQQANSYYNSQLNDKIPELYQLAYDMYLNDKESMVQDLGILQNMDATQYGRYRDTINDYYNDKNFAYGAYYDALQQGNWQTTYDYNAMTDNRDFAQDYRDFMYEDSWKNKEWEANRADVEYDKTLYEQESAQSQIDELVKYGEMPSDDLIAKSGMDKSYVQQLVNAVRREKGLPSIGSSGGGSTGGSTTKTTTTVTDKPKDTDKPKETEDKETDEVKDLSSSSVLSLGIGPVNNTTLEKLALAGAVVVKNDGSVKWANGYNKDNYQKALNKVHTQGSYLLW